VIHHRQNLLLHLRSLQLLPYGQRFSVHNLHGVVEALRPSHHGVLYLAEVHVPDVAAAEPPQEAEVVEADAAGVEAEAPHGLP